MTHINKFISKFSNLYRINNKLIEHLNFFEQNIIGWKKFIKIDQTNYCRNIIYKNDLFEAYLLNWKPGDKTKFHYHPQNGCIMKLLHGKLDEIIINNNEIKTNIYTNNKSSYIDNYIGGHIIENNTNSHVFSLHVYSPINYYN